MRSTIKACIAACLVVIFGLAVATWATADPLEPETGADPAAAVAETGPDPVAAVAEDPPDPSGTPTPTPTVPVVPIPALFDANPTPPTCETPGSFDVEDVFPGVTVTVSPAYDGPGVYTLTITAENGATFPDGTTTKTRVITVEAA